MSKIYKGVMELIGSTPLVEIINIEQQEKLKATLFVRLEYLDPVGGVKDRVGEVMIEGAEQRGILKPGSVVIEPTSGNTRIGLISITATKGYRVILTIPDTTSIERRNILKAYGAEIALTPEELGMTGAIEEAEELAREIPGNSIPGQFMNPANPKARVEATGPEIRKDIQGKVGLFVVSVGTGGTTTGAGTYLERGDPDLKVIVVEPAVSAVFSGKAAGLHKIQGIGAGFVPEVLDTGIYGEIITVDNDVSFATSKMLTHTKGLFTSIPSGAVLYAIIQAAKWSENEGGTIVTLLPDSGDRHYSTPLFVEWR